MKNIKSANVVAMIIGLVGVAFGIYSLAQGQTLKESGYTLFIGITLFGAAFLNYKQLKKQDNQ